MPQDQRIAIPSPGFGLGLRPVHYPDFLARPQPVEWLEIISENYMVPGGRPMATLDRIRADYPIVMHGVSLSIGSDEPLDHIYLSALKELADRVDPLWISDHLCWTGINAHNSHDLLPLPYDAPALTCVVDNIARVQDYLKTQSATGSTSQSSVAVIGQIVQGQALLLAYIDVFVMLAALAGLMVPLALSLRTVRRGGATPVH